jgi:PAS domain S-box-containing protein
MTRAGTGGARFPSFSATLSASYLLELAIIAASYFGFAKTALLVPAINATAMPLWPPTGVALSVILLRGDRVWPAILIGSIFATAITSSPMALLDLDSNAIATMVAALAGAWLINRWSQGYKTLASPLNVARFALISFAPTAVISSGIAIAAPVLTNALGFANSPVISIGTWAKWWLTDAAGIVIIAPVILLWAMTPLRRFLESSIMEAAVIIVVASAIGAVAYSPIIGGDLNDPLPNRDIFGFLILLPLMWAGLCGTQRDAATAAFIFSGFAAWGASSNGGALLATGFNRSPFYLLALSVSTSLASLFLGATINSRRDTEARLLSSQLLLKLQFDQTKLAFQNIKRHFQIFIEGVADYAIFLLDTSGRVTSWNTAAQKVVGYKTDEIVVKHFGILYRPDERRGGEPNRALELAIKKGKHEVEGWRVRKDGRPFFVTGSLATIRDDDDKLIGFANIIRDATERYDAQEKLIEAREQLAMAQKMEAIGKLTGASRTTLTTY